MTEQPADAPEKKHPTTAIVLVNPPPEQPADWKINLLRVLVLVAVIGVSLLLINQRAQIQRLAGVGYLQPGRNRRRGPQNDLLEVFPDRVGRPGHQNALYRLCRFFFTELVDRLV
jgi:hypothetical protein